MGKKSNAALPLDPALDAWEQQEDETEQAFESFFRYLMLGRGNRSLETVAHELDKSKQLMSRWSRQWSWRVRVVEFDRAEDRQKIERHWDEVEKMGVRHVNASKVLQGAMLAPARAVISAMQERPQLFMEYFMVDGVVDFHRLERTMGMVIAVARTMPQVIGIERTALGEPVEITGEQADPRQAASQFLDDAETREVAQQFFARMNGMLLPTPLEESEPGVLPTGELIDGDDIADFAESEDEDD